MSIGKAASVGGELIDVGGLEFGSSVAAEVAVTEVVGEDEDDVGLFGAFQLENGEPEGGSKLCREFHVIRWQWIGYPKEGQSLTTK